MARVDPYPIRQGQKALTPKQKRELAAQEASAGFVNAMGGEGGAGYSRTLHEDADATKSAKRIKSNRFGTLAKNLGKGAQQALTQEPPSIKIARKIGPAVHEGMKRVGEGIASGVEGAVEERRNLDAINKSRRAKGLQPITLKQMRSKTRDIEKRGKPDSAKRQRRAGRAVRQALGQKTGGQELIGKVAPTARRLGKAWTEGVMKLTTWPQLIVEGKIDKEQVEESARVKKEGQARRKILMNRRKNDNWGEAGPPVMNNKKKKPRY